MCEKMVRAITPIPRLSDLGYEEILKKLLWFQIARCMQRIRGEGQNEIYNYIR